MAIAESILIPMQPELRDKKGTFHEYHSGRLSGGGEQALAFKGGIRGRSGGGLGTEPTSESPHKDCSTKSCQEMMPGIIAMELIDSIIDCVCSRI